jgi:biotin carboxyl carrier protein
MKLRLDGFEYDVQVEEGAVVVDGQRLQVSRKGSGLTQMVTVGGRTIRVDLGEPAPDGTRTANVDGKVWQVQRSGPSVAAVQRPVPTGGGTPAAPRSARPAGKGAVTAQMTGRILRVEVQQGDEVAEGALLLVLEAMKMENEIRAPRAGRIKAVVVNVGDRVNTGDPLVEFEA